MRRGEPRRGYDDACGTAHALELIGERWALLVLRELLLGPRRFSDLRADLPAISANVLTQRLGDLEQAGLLTRRKLPPPASVQVYELTPEVELLLSQAYIPLLTQLVQVFGDALGRRHAVRDAGYE